MYKVLITDRLSPTAIDLFNGDSRFDVTERLELSPDQLIGEIPSYHALMVRSGTKVTEKIISAADNLKVIGRAGTGLDNIDTAAAEARGIEVLNTPGSNAQAVAELSIGLMFALARRFYPAFESMKSHRWDKSSLTGSEVSRKTLGLIGFGQIGQKVGLMAAGIGMKVLVYKPSPVIKSPGYEYELVPLADLLSKSDFISLHLPKTDQTAHMIGRAQFQSMKSSAFVINCSRGGIVDEKELKSALDQGVLAGAALDVFEEEPPRHFDLIDHQRVISTPHIGASTGESQERVGQDIVRSVMDFLIANYVFIGRD